VFGVVVTAILKVSLAARPPRSVAVALTLSVPTFAAAGVPLNVCVAALNVSHIGSGEPSAAVAVYVSASPASTSVKVPAGQR
jgi:hypothetical protein